MKVLVIASDASIFSPESPAHARMKQYADVFGELHLISRAPRHVVASVEGSLHLYPAHVGKLGALFALVPLARRIIKKQGIEIVSAQDPFEQGLAAMRAVKGTKAKLHIQVHTDFLSPWFSGMVNRLRVFIAGTVLARAQGIRAVSRRIADSIQKKYGSRVVAPQVVPLTISSELPQPAPLPHRSFSFTFLTIARLEKEKRIEDILHALTRLPAYAGLVIIGDGRERAYLEKLAASLGLSERVVFMGWRTDSLALMQSADAYVQASAYEGYGRTLIEAALAGLPVVTTDVGIVGDVLHDGEEALIVSPGNPELLAASMDAVVQDDALRSRLGGAARDAAHRHLVASGNLAQAVRDDLARLLV